MGMSIEICRNRKMVINRRLLLVDASVEISSLVRKLLESGTVVLSHIKTREGTESSLAVGANPE